VKLLPLRKTTGSTYSYGYVVIAAGFLIWLIGGSNTPVFSVLLKPVLTEFGWSQADAALGYSLAFISQGLLGIIMGRLTDTLGPRIVIVIFGSFQGISYLLLSRVNTLWQYQLNYALISAIGASTITAPVMATVARWFDKRRGLMIGIVQTGLGFSGLIFAPLVAWLTLTHDWRYAYTVMGIIAVTGMVIGGLFLKNRPEEDEPGKRNGHAATAGAPSSDHAPHSHGLSLREAVSTRQFWIIAALFMSFGFCRSAFTPFTAPMVQEKGFNLTDAANVVAALTLSSNFGRVLMGRVADGIGNRRTLLISEGLTTASFALGLIVSSLPGLYLYAILFGFGWGAQAVLRFSVCSEAFGMASVGVVMGALHLAETIGASSGMYITGRIFDATGSYAPAFWMGLCISLIGMALVSPSGSDNLRRGREHGRKDGR
jgi:MFS family permease